MYINQEDQQRYIHEHLEGHFSENKKKIKFYKNVVTSKTFFKNGLLTGATKAAASPPNSL